MPYIDTFLTGGQADFSTLTLDLTTTTKNTITATPEPKLTIFSRSVSQRIARLRPGKFWGTYMQLWVFGSY